MIIPRGIRLEGRAVFRGEMRNAYRILVGRIDRKRPLGKPGRKWEFITTTNLEYIGWKDSGLDPYGSGLVPVVGC
jgi:hypothetical protein